ncbi:hypothetical protein TRFO_11554 [Tritrichomonas foetus]|uniref:Uncharacterized protein n=1 Tax=Tritrichomonas foetus TaxID=1144522 RepID=A0A1J4J965_9EUKA|nr:hypothetical protein TRFO_11554 [Tritrichomonas foetus]|eukprot:OHS93764.1 hypothetical protein TRFO_11554 [Tritrichomonas foetus]
MPQKNSISLLLISFPIILFYEYGLFSSFNEKIFSNSLTAVVLPYRMKHNPFMDQHDFDIISFGCDVAKKHKFIPKWTIDENNFIESNIVQCNPNNTAFGAREFDSLFTYFYNHYDDLRNKTIFTHAHDRSHHYPTPPLKQVAKLVKTQYFYETDYGEYFPWYIRRPITQTNDQYLAQITLYKRDYVPIMFTILEGTELMKDEFNKTLQQCLKDGHPNTIVTRSSSFFVWRDTIRHYPRNDYLKLVENIHHHIQTTKIPRYSHLMSEYLERTLQLLLARRCVRNQPPPELGKESISNCC